MSEEYEIDAETLEICKALEFYDMYRHFPWEKKKVLFSIDYSTAIKLEGISNKSAMVNKVLSKNLE